MATRTPPLVLRHLSRVGLTLDAFGNPLIEKLPQISEVPTDTAERVAKRGAPVCSCLSGGTAVLSQVSDASVPCHLRAPTSTRHRRSPQGAFWDLGLVPGHELCRKPAFLTWGAGGADTPALFFSSSFLAQSQAQGRPKGSFLALPGGFALRGCPCPVCTLICRLGVLPVESSAC